MWQQLGHYLFKQIDTIQAGQEADEQLNYLSTKDNPTPCSVISSKFLDLSVQLSIYRQRAQRLIFKAHWHLRSARKPGVKVWNEQMMLVIAASRAHME